MITIGGNLIAHGLLLTAYILMYMAYRSVRKICEIQAKHIQELTDNSSCEE